MAFLDKIVESINDAVKVHLCAFPTAEYFGITYLIPKSDGRSPVYLPAIIGLDGEAKIMAFDDLHELSLYHKIVGSAYKQIKAGYGDSHDYIEQSYDMDLIVMSDRKKVNIHPDVLEIAIASNIPSKVKLDKIDFVNITAVSTNHSAKSVFGTEFTGVEYYLKPEHILFSIRYRVELRYQKGCISLCHCD